MAIVVGLDQHREQMTYDLLDTETGEVRRGRIRPADRVGVRRFLKGLAGERVEAAVEATTDRRLVVEELVEAGATPPLAEPAETRTQRGPKRRHTSELTFNDKVTNRGARNTREVLMYANVYSETKPQPTRCDSGSISGTPHAEICAGALPASAALAPMRACPRPCCTRSRGTRRRRPPARDWLLRRSCLCGRDQRHRRHGHARHGRSARPPHAPAASRKHPGRSVLS